MIKDSILKTAFQYISCFMILQSAFSSKHYLTIFTCSLSPSHFILHLLINLLHLLLDEFSWMNSSLIHLFVWKPFLFYVIPVAYSFLILQYFLKRHNLTCRHLSVPYQHLMQKHIISVITLYRMIDSHRQWSIKIVINLWLSHSTILFLQLHGPLQANTKKRSFVNWGWKFSVVSFCQPSPLSRENKCTRWRTLNSCYC